MREPKKCPVCGEIAQPTYVCQGCGVEIKLDPKKDIKRLDKCPLCGGDLILTYFCPTCGTEVTEGESEQLSCPVCGAPLVGDEEFCPECGSPLAYEEVEEVLYECPLCGSEIPLGADTCPNCGAKFEGDELEGLTELVSLESEFERKKRRLRGGYTEEDMRKIMRIPGVGRVKAETLCRYGYNTLKRIKEADTQEIASIPHIGKKNARAIKKAVSNIDISQLEGSELIEEVIEEEFECPVCGTIVSAFDTSCYECGVDFEDEGIEEDALKEVDREKAALSFYDMKLMNSPANHELWFARGAVLARMSDYEGALQSFDRCIELDPKGRKYWMVRAQMLTALGRYREAAFSYSRAAKLAGGQMDIKRDASSLSEEEMIDILFEEAKPTATCPSCGARIPDNITICPECGFDLLPREESTEVLERAGLSSLEELEEEEPTKCPLCGALIPPGATICPECGYSEKKSDILFDELDSFIAEEKGPGETEAVPADDEILSGKKEVKGARGRKSEHKKRGLTNGIGRTNGLTNGNGMTNGLTNGVGRTNGLTNGVKMHKGLTNGVSGAKKARKKAAPPSGGGRINGLTNGTGRLGHGKVNGITNGSGFIQTAGITTVSGFWTKKKYSGITIFVFLMLMFGVYATTIAPQIQSGNMGAIDGSFSEWSEKYHYKIADMGTGNPDIDVISASSYLSNNYLYFMLEVKGQIAPSATVCTYFILVDIDNNASTGYDINGFGADYLVDLYGRNGQVNGMLKIFPDSGTNWADWQDFTSVSAARGSGSDASMLEVGIPLYSGLSSVREGDVNAVIATLDSVGHRGVSSWVFGPDGLPTIRISQSGVPDMEAIISGNSAEITALTIESNGPSGDTISVTVTGHLSSGTLDSASADLTGIGPSSMKITADVSAVPAGTAVYYSLHRDGVSATSGGNRVHVGITDVHASAYAFSAPDGIVIDGAFADWANVTKKVDAIDAGIPESVDINSSAGIESGTTLFFFSQTRGNILEGTPVPFERQEFASTGSSSPPSQPPSPVYGRDLLRIYVDTDSSASTGLGIGGIGADLMAEFDGQYGDVVSSHVYSFDGKGWEITAGKLEGKACGRDFEGSMDLTSFAPASQNISFVVYTSDWAMHSDLSSLISTHNGSGSLRSAPEEPAPLPEFSDFMPILFVGVLVFYFHRRRR